MLVSLEHVGNCVCQCEKNEFMRVGDAMCHMCSGDARIGCVSDPITRIDVSKARGHGGEHPAAGKLTPNQLVSCCVEAAWLKASTLPGGFCE